MFWRTSGHLFRGWVFTQRRDIATGMDEMRIALADITLMEVGIYQSYCLDIFAEACLAASEIDEGLGAIEAELYRIKGELLLRRRKSNASANNIINDAKACFRTARDIANAQKAILFHLRATNSLARLYIESGQHNSALDILTVSYDNFSEGFNHPDLLGAKRLIGM